MEMRHKKFNIRFSPISAENLIGLDAAQAASLAEWINEVLRRGAETEFLLSCHETSGEVPADLAFLWPKVEDYEEEA